MLTIISRLSLVLKVTLAKTPLQEVRNYTRWAHRNPRRVILPESMKESSSSDEDERKSPNEASMPISSEPKRKTKTKTIKKSQGIEVFEHPMDNEGNFQYTKMKEDDSRISTVLVEAKSMKKGNMRTSVVLEGRRLIQDAIDAGCNLQYLLFSRTNDLEHFRNFLTPKSTAKLYKMPYRDMQVWSTLDTCPGLMAVIKRPDLTIPAKAADQNFDLNIICDNIRDPGNMGSALRVAAAVGCRNVFLTKGCVDLWDSKVVRSGAGAHFRIPIQRSLEWHDLAQLISPKSYVFIAEINSDISADEKDQILPYYKADIDTASSVTVIIGGETKGVSEDAVKFSKLYKGNRLHIPLSNRVESLNSATALGIIVFDLKKRMCFEGT